MVAINGVLFVFGGTEVAFNVPGALSDLWQYDLATNAWSPITAAGGPSGRLNCAMAASGGKVWVYGGMTGLSGSSLLSDLFVFDPWTNAWTDMTQVEPPPSGRHSASMAAANGKLYLYGGNDFVNYLPDLHVFDTAGEFWTTLTGKPGSPSGRFESGVSVLDNKLYVFGGQAITASGGGSWVDEFYVFDLAAEEWTELTDATTPGNAWAPMVASDDSLYILGNPGSAGSAQHLHVYAPGCAPQTQGCVPIATTAEPAPPTTTLAAAPATTPMPTPDPNAIADPAFPVGFDRFFAIRPEHFPAIVGINSEIEVLMLNHGNADTTGAVVELSMNDWGVTYGGWQPMSTLTYDVLAGNNAVQSFNHVFPSRAHVCLRARITNPGTGGNSNPWNDITQVNLQVLNAGEAYTLFIPFGNAADEEIVVSGTQILCLTNGTVGPCAMAVISGTARRMLSDALPVLHDAPGYGQDDVMGPNSEQIARLELPYVPDEGLTVVVEAVMNGETNNVMLNVVRTSVAGLFNEAHLCCIKSVRTRVLLEVMLADALEAYEAGECKKAMKLLRMLVQKAMLLECDLDPDEVRCIEQFVLKLVDAAIMIAHEKDGASQLASLQEAHFFRRQGLYEAALMEAAKAC